MYKKDLCIINKHDIIKKNFLRRIFMGKISEIFNFDDIGRKIKKGAPECMGAINKNAERGCQSTGQAAEKDFCGNDARRTGEKAHRQP